MLKRLLKLFLILAVLVLLGYAGGNYLLHRYSARIVTHYKRMIRSKGVDINNFKYSRINFTFPPGLTIHQVHLDLSLNKKLYMDKPFKAKFDAASANLKLVSLLHPAFNFSLSDFDLYVESADGLDNQRQFGKFEHAYFKNYTPIAIKDPEMSVKEVLQRVNKLFNENNTETRFDFNGDVLLSMEGKTASVKLYTVQESGMTTLKFNIDDIMKASKIFEVDMVEAEAKVVSDYPMRVPMMIKITRAARRISENAKKADGSIPEDAYRHVYWSYHLTKEFGPQFAEQITNAHETAPGNTKQERQMDYHNNEVGRKYAQENLPEDQIFHQVLHAPEVIRRPQLVKLTN